MERPWLVLLLVGCVLLAGCSLPGSGPTDGSPTDGGTGGDGGTYPPGWSADGLTNATAAIQAADSAVAGEDFRERRVVVQPVTVSGEQKYLVDELVVRLDRENERLMTQRRYYLVSNETARNVVDSGVEVLDDRRPDEVRRTYLNASGGLQYHRLANRSPRVTQLQSGNFSSATDQPMPAAYASAVPMLESGTFTNAETTDGSVTYTVENVTAKPFQSGSGQVTVRQNGLVPEFSITQTGQAGPAAYTYEFERRDVTVEPPNWNVSGGDASATPTPGTTATGTTASSN